MANGSESSGSAKWASGVAIVLAGGLLVVFAFVAWAVVNSDDVAPRLADPAATTAPTAGPNGQYPPQLRGSYDPNARLLALLAVVSPLLTTVVGFYFGQRAGAAGQDAAEARADRDKTAVTSIIKEHARTSGTPEAQSLLQDLQSKGLVKE